MQFYYLHLDGSKVLGEEKKEVLQCGNKAGCLLVTLEIFLWSSSVSQSHSSTPAEADSLNAENLRCPNLQTHILVALIGSIKVKFNSLKLEEVLGSL